MTTEEKLNNATKKLRQQKMELKKLRQEKAILKIQVADLKNDIEISKPDIYDIWTN